MVVQNLHVAYYIHTYLCLNNMDVSCDYILLSVSSSRFIGIWSLPIVIILKIMP